MPEEHGFTDEDMRASMHDPADWDALTEKEKQSLREFAEVAGEIQAQLPPEYSVGDNVRLVGPIESSYYGKEGEVTDILDPANQPEKWLPGAQVMYLVEYPGGSRYLRAVELEAV